MKWDTDLTWDKYFKQVDIYQGRSHWTDLKNLLLKLKNKITSDGE